MHRHRPSSRRAVGLTEYIVVVVLIAIGVLLAVEVFGQVEQEKYLGAEIEVYRIDTQAQ